MKKNWIASMQEENELQNFNILHKLWIGVTFLLIGQGFWEEF